MPETIYCKSYEYVHLKRKYHSKALFNDSPTRRDIVDSVFRGIQLFCADIDYAFVKSEVEKILDREGYRDPDICQLNPYYNPNIQIIIKQEATNEEQNNA
jgi:hypothetical protein